MLTDEILYDNTYAYRTYSILRQLVTLSLLVPCALFLTTTTLPVGYFPWTLLVCNVSAVSACVVSRCLRCVSYIPHTQPSVLGSQYIIGGHNQLSARVQWPMFLQCARHTLNLSHWCVYVASTQIVACTCGYVAYMYGLRCEEGKYVHSLEV